MNESTATPSALPRYTGPIRLTWRRSRTRHGGDLALPAILLSRVIVWAAALLAVALFGRELNMITGFDPQHLTEPFRSGWANALVAPTARWDSVWYLRIAQHGYAAPPAAAFYPLYPLLIRAGASVLGAPIVVGAAISIVSGTVALVLVHRLGRLDLSESESRLTVLLIAFFPTALFLSAVYTESLFLALSLGSVYSARRERWAWAGILGGLSAATRSEGVLLVVPLALLFLYGPRPGWPMSLQQWRPSHPFKRAALWIGLVPAGLLAFVAFMALSGHGATAPFHAEAIWGRRLAGPLGGVVALARALPGNVKALAEGVPAQPHDLIDLGFLLFAVAGLAAGRRRVPFAYSAYGVLTLVEAVSYPRLGSEPLASLPRYVLMIFPAFMGWAIWLEGRRRLRWAVLGASAGLLAVFSGLWATWAWLA